MTLFEKEGQMGGHSFTDESPGVPIDLGFQVNPNCFVKLGLQEPHNAVPAWFKTLAACLPSSTCQIADWPWCKTCTGRSEYMRLAQYGIAGIQPDHLPELGGAL